MTDQQLRDLLTERVVDVSMPDVSATAWRDGRRAHRRDRAAVLGCVAMVAAVITTGVAVLGTGDPTRPSPAPGAPTPSATATSDVVPPGSTADATYLGVPVWWSLAQEQEVNLPYVESSPLPQVIDLRSGPMVKAMDRAVAAFDVTGEIRLVDADGGQLSVDISRLDDVVKPNGYGYRPTHVSMLSPGGDYLVFPQNGSVEVYTIDTGEWTSVDTGDEVTRFVTWVGDDAFALPPKPGKGGRAFRVDGSPAMSSDVLVESDLLRPPFDTADARAYGRTVTSVDGRSQAQSWGMGVPVPVADAGQFLSDPEFIAAHVGGVSRVLSIQWNLRDQGHAGRFLQCCPVAGWLDDRTLVYESRQTDPALVAWSVATNHFALVSRIEGQYLLASFADLD